MSPIVVTTGQRFTDLDALACVIAFCEINPTKYIPIIPGPLNHSVTQTIRQWGLKYEIKPPAAATGYIIMDVSEDKYIAEFVDINKVVEIYDHHYGFENVWAARLWVKATIIEIGACATLVWEEIIHRKMEGRSEKLDDEMGSGNIDRSIQLPTSLSSFPTPTSHLISATAANLLYTAIVTHTLNFKINITKDRDRQAAKELEPYCKLPNDWISQYYREIEADIYRNPRLVIANDTKVANLGGQSIAIGQMEMWLSENFVKDNQNIIKAVLREFGTELWLLSSPCISKGINYLLTDNQSVKEWLKIHIGAVFPANGSMGYTQRLWLRKEILRELENK